MDLSKEVLNAEDVILAQATIDAMHMVMALDGSCGEGVLPGDYACTPTYLIRHVFQPRKRKGAERQPPMTRMMLCFTAYKIRSAHDAAIEKLHLINDD